MFNQGHRERMCYQRRIEHLHRLGPRAVGELLSAVADRIGGAPAINALLAEYEHVAPATLQALGGDSFPQSRLRAVPR